MGGIRHILVNIVEDKYMLNENNGICVVQENNKRVWYVGDIDVGWGKFWMHSKHTKLAHAQQALEDLKKQDDIERGS